MYLKYFDSEVSPESPNCSGEFQTKYFRCPATESFVSSGTVDGKKFVCLEPNCSRRTVESV
jgi:hypothetical protein